jgi:anti-sigma-K factor RskA
MNEEQKEKMLNLLADRALFGLSETEAAELEELTGEFPEFQDDYSFDLAAADVNLTNLKFDDPLPAHLQTKILDDAEQFFAQAEEKQNASDFKTRESTPTVETSTQIPWWSWLGWGVAAAACIALAVNLWLTRVQPKTEIVKNPEVIQTPMPELTTQQKREQLLASAKDLVQTSWTEVNPKQPRNVSGDIVWSNAEQKGYLRFRGLPPNDPNRETYQLWIFDEGQDPKTPIDGGVFDVRENGEVIIPINAKLPVKKPLVFAVTAEKPGGVVVSKQEKVMTIAKV